MKNALTYWIWGVASLVAVIASAVAGAFLLDILVVRPVVDGGSITTLLPGAVYGSVLVMKVCIGQSLVLMLIGVGVYFFFQSDKRQFPIWSVVSLMIPPLVPLGMAIGVLMLQGPINQADSVSMSSFRHLSRSAVFIMIGLLSIATLASIAAIVRSEKPRGLGFVSLVTNAFLLATFRYWEFYKLGFDQDRWNDI